MKYKPYMMKDVIAGEKQNKFKVISTFYAHTSLVIFTQIFNKTL